MNLPATISAPWAGLGTDLDLSAAMTPEEILQASCLDWTVAKQELPTMRKMDTLRNDKKDTTSSAINESIKKTIGSQIQSLEMFIDKLLVEK